MYGGDAAGVPLSDEVRQRAAAGEFMSWAKWKFVHITEDQPMTNIEVAVSPPLSQIVHILQKRVRAPAEQLLHRGVNGMRPGVRGGE